MSQSVSQSVSQSSQSVSQSASRSVSQSSYLVLVNKKIVISAVCEHAFFISAIEAGLFTILYGILFQLSKQLS